MATKKVPQTKAHKARIVFNRMTKAGKERKDIIKAFVDKVGLTAEGAKTYYYNLTKAE